MWHIDLGQPIGHEAGSRRYGLVISADAQNLYGLLSVLPITETRTGYPSNIEIEAGLFGLDVTSYVQVEQIRTVSLQRFDTFAGSVNGSPLMLDVERVLRWVLALP